MSAFLETNVAVRQGAVSQRCHRFTDGLNASASCVLKIFSAPLVLIGDQLTQATLSVACGWPSNGSIDESSQNSVARKPEESARIVLANRLVLQRHARKAAGFQDDDGRGTSAYKPRVSSSPAARR